MPMALAADGTPRGVDVGRGRRVGGGGGRHRAEQLPRPGEGGAPLPIGEQPEVPDADEATRQHVQEKTPEEFLDAERHDFRVPAIRVVLPAEPHDAIGQADQSGVREGDAVCVATQVLEHLRRPGKQRQSILPIVTEKRLSSTTRIIL